MEKLRAKYMHSHFYDAYADDDHLSELYRVVNIESHQVTSSVERRSGMKSQNQVVAMMCIARHGKDLQDDNREMIYVSCAINDELHVMIRQCLEPYNEAFNLSLGNIDL